MKSTSLSVFAAASLCDAFKELGRRFENAHPGIKVEFSFAGSQQLLAQLRHGAPADIFAPASAEEMRKALQENLVDAKAHDIFAFNRLVLVSPERAPVKSLEILADSKLKLAIADESVPAGRYTRQFLESLRKDKSVRAGLVDAIERRVVSREANVRAVLTKVTLGEADAGFVYESGASGVPGLFALALPGEHSPLASFPIGMVQSTAAPALAKQFIGLVLSKDGQQVLHDYGFLSANEVH